MDGHLARYDMRKNEDGESWTVFDVFTGEPAIVDGVQLVSLEIEEADDLVDLLNARYARRQSGEAG